MNTRFVMISSAVVTGGAGITLTFLPQEILLLLHHQPIPAMTLVLQLLGALLFGFGMVNWTAREMLLGGIYGRPIVIGNVTHFTVGALALMKGISADQSAVVWAVAGMYTLFALLFGITMYTHPKQQ